MARAECRVDAAPDLARVIVAVDPPASSGENANECGIVAEVNQGGEMVSAVTGLVART